MDTKAIIDWLLEGDVSIQYQVHRDLFGEHRPDFQARIENEGWGSQFLSKRNENGHWGKAYYQPKWISSHYTLLDLKHLAINPNQVLIKETIDLILGQEKADDGGINPSDGIKESDVCMNGMVLNFACYFGAEESKLCSVVDFIIKQQLPDGGFNCRFNRSGAKHSSLHSTISVLEGIHEYLANGYSYRDSELKEITKLAREFILLHQLYISDRTGEIINQQFLRLSYPSRWKFDILRALDYFQNSNTPFDERMIPALQILIKKRKKDRSWPVQAKHPGQVHFDMEKAGTSSRWNTLRALRVLKHYDMDIHL